MSYKVVTASEREDLIDAGDEIVLSVAQLAKLCVFSLCLCWRHWGMSLSNIAFSFSQSTRLLYNEITFPINRDKDHNEL